MINELLYKYKGDARDNDAASSRDNFQERALVFSNGSCVGIPVLHSYHVHISSTAQGTVLRSALEGLKINQTFGAIASSASSIKIPNTLSLPSEISSTR
jgi:hypothetical protein